MLIHWGVASAFAQPLLDEPALGGYQLLTYHRAGFGASGRIDGPLTMADHARHCRLLMRHLGIEQAHVVGHSSSATIALQVALDFPDAAHTVVSMEAARPIPSTELQAEFIRTYIQPAMQCYRAGDRAGAVDTFFRGVFGEGYGPSLEEGLPGAFDQAVAEADAFFGQELPALQQWEFTGTTRAAPPSRCCSCSARSRRRPSPSGASCCSRGCRTQSLSISPTFGTSCTSSALRTSPRRLPGSSHDTRSRRAPERC